MQGLFVDRIHFFKLLSLSDKPRLHQLKILLLLVVQDQILWLSHSFNPYGEIPSSKGKHPVLRTNTKPHQLIKHPHISYSIVSLAFRRFSCSTYRIGLRYLKAEAFQVLTQNIQTMLVWYLLSGICISVYSCTGCSTSKIYLCLGDNRSSSCKFKIWN